MCQDIEGLARGKLSLPEMPTVETAKTAQNIEYNRENTWDNVHNAIIFATNAKKAYKKNFDDVDMNSADYYTRLGNHTKKLDELEKFSNSLSVLFDAAKSLDDGTISKISQVRETLNLPKTDNNQFQNPQTYPNGYTTGLAADLGNLLAFEDVFIPYENMPENEDERDKTPAVLEGHVEKTEDYMSQINYELHNFENSENNSLSSNKLKKYTEISRFNRLKSLVEALFYVIRNEKDSPNEKINQFKKEMNQELYEYDQSTYPKRKISRSLSKFSTTLQDLHDAYVIWKYNKKQYDYFRLLLFLRCLTLWRETNKRLDEFYSRPDIQITNKELDIKNDMRHITGLVFYTQKYGPEQARKYGYLKEKLDFYQEGDIKDSFIDFDNNERGIAFGVKYKNLNKDETIEKIYEEFIKKKREIKKTL